MTDLSWEKALRVQGFAVTHEVKVSGWPESFSVGHLARLQYPVEGSDAEKRKARNNQRAIEEAMTSAIADGKLEAEKHSRTVTVEDNSHLFRPIALGSREWREWDLPPPPPRRPPQQKTETWHTIARANFRDWLARQGEAPSEHIRAWLRPLEQAKEADQDKAVPTTPKTPMKRAAIIERLRRRYPRLESALDRGEDWAKACRVSKDASPAGKQGWYYLECIEAECLARYGGAAPAPAADLSLAGQLRSTC